MNCIGFALGLAILHCDLPPAPAVPVARLCEVAKVIRYSRQDSAETRRQLRYHNAAVRSACGAR